jgi:hypothetical protein
VAVIAWAAAIETAIQETPEDTPFFVLIDVSGDGVAFTPLARQHSKRIFGTYRNRIGYVAMVFEWRTSPYFARLFFSTLGRLAFKLRYFHDGAEAQEWLRTVVDEG